jgi:regulatory protein
LPRARKSPPSSPQSTLQARAVALLARREYSRSELRAKLAGVRSGADADLAEIDAVLEELSARGYLSDARFAQQFAQQKSGALSKRAIGASLKARGVEGAAATDALAGVEIDDDEAMTALWRRRFGAAPSSDKEKARQVRFLQSRGFSLSAIIKLLRNPPGDESSGGA